MRVIASAMFAAPAVIEYRLMFTEAMLMNDLSMQRCGCQTACGCQTVLLGGNEQCLHLCIVCEEWRATSAMFHGPFKECFCVKPDCITDQHLPR